MTILKNAIDSIVIGLEDYKSSDDRRIVSATRNIFAGILLLFKHKLCELSPTGSDEVLIKQRVLPEMDITGRVNWVGKGAKTVDVNSIRDRFESLNIDVDWKRLDRINQYRNDIEHYYSTLRGESVQQLISDSFLIIRDFISDELHKDPKLLLGDECWNILVNAYDVYDKEQSNCEATIDALEFFSSGIAEAIKAYGCEKCGSRLIESTESGGSALDASFKCRSCDHSLKYAEIIDAAIVDYYAKDVYNSPKDIDYTAITNCPLCHDGIYIYSEGVCASCGDS